jgi:hypothetical protein
MLDVVHAQAGLFLTVPIDMHFNIPYAEWLYLGAGVKWHIPLSDMGLDGLIGSNITKYFPGGSIKGKTFMSVPIDLGFDFSKGAGAEENARRRLILRIEPEFFEHGMRSYPFSLVWQSRNWRPTTVKIPGTF